MKVYFKGQDNKENVLYTIDNPSENNDKDITIALFIFIDKLDVKEEDNILSRIYRKDNVEIETERLKKIIKESLRWYHNYITYFKK